MKSLLAVSGSVLFVLAIAACALDAGPESGDNPATMSVDSSEIVTVPSELSPNASDSSCHITVTSCNPSSPTACFKGNCGASAQDEARTACVSECALQPSVCKKVTVTRC